MDKTLLEAGRLLAAAKTIVLSTHVMPDGDGLGAEVALYHYLKRIGKSVRIINPDPYPKRYGFLDRGVFEVHANTKKKYDEFDLLVVVDTNDPKRIAHLWEPLSQKAKNILFLDHHPKLEDEDHPPMVRGLKIHEVVDVKSSSIGELLYRLFHQAHDFLAPKFSSFTFTPEIALGLYVSIITDTNSFRYARTTALSHRIAAELIDFGLQPEEIYQNIFSTKALGHLRLIGEVLALVDEQPREGGPGNVAWIEIPLKLRKKFGATSDDTQSIVNFLLLLKEAEILVLLREEDDGKIKASIKSKGTIRVNHIAQEFGGGGHEFAAGFSANGDMSQIRKKLVAKLIKIS